MAVFAENSDGTGESSYYVASQTPIRINFGTKLANKISFVRYNLTVDSGEMNNIALEQNQIVKQMEALMDREHTTSMNPLFQIK